MVRPGPEPCRPGRLPALLAAGLLALGLPLAGHAHEYHASTAEVDYNAESGHLEVALKVLPEDLEDALSRRAHRRISLDATADVDARILAYLQSCFRVVDAEGEPRPLVWVGKEVSYQAAWLYFEVPVDPAVAWRLEHRVLFDLAAEQVNTVQLTVFARRSTLVFTADRAVADLPPLRPE